MNFLKKILLWISTPSDAKSIKPVKQDTIPYDYWGSCGYRRINFDRKIFTPDQEGCSNCRHAVAYRRWHCEANKGTLCQGLFSRSFQHYEPAYIYSELTPYEQKLCRKNGIDVAVHK